MDHINNLRQQLKFFEIQLQFNFSPTKLQTSKGLLTASQEIDAAIAQLGVPLAKLPSTPEETSRIIKAVTERRDQTSNNIAQPATAAAASKDTGTKPKQPTKRKYFTRYAIGQY
ncbi:hypothetical protein CEXT_453881 [Caerostris extrusa]|uniref:Uncharacterized protein n=1 Tax=Caerostris extrusa TaxID=172846 RepID=A0AAV4WPZ3_CAEEX|nr:hypothetical protein CEXT_453881 [Caerostris extrusa]